MVTNRSLEDFKPFTDYQKKLYSDVSLPGNKGKGEVSIALLLVQKSLPQLFDSDGNPINNVVTLNDEIVYFPEEKIKLKINEMVDIGNKPYDVHDCFTGKKYEVKEIKSASVRTGKYSFRMAIDIFMKVAKSVDRIYYHYNRLSPNEKQLIEKYRPSDCNASFEENIINAYNYFTNSAGELPRSAITHDTKNPNIPKIYQIPMFFDTNIYKDLCDKGSSIHSLLEDIYCISFEDSKKIDKKIREYIKRKKITNHCNEEYFDELDEFLCAVQTSVFANTKTYYRDVESYFIKNSPNMKQALEATFPNDGVFIVDSNKGYKYVSRDNLSNNLKISCISQGKFKVVSINEQIKEDDTL
jgi:hypothetical protein